MNKKFSEATDKEIWADLTANSMAEALKQELINRAASGPGWCCELARKFAHVVAKDGTRMLIVYCPRCGKQLR